MTERLDAMPQLREGIAGHRVVAVIYVTVLAIAGLMGALIGYIKPVALDPTLFFLVDLPPTALGMAVFGVVTVGTGLGLLLFGVRFASRYDSARVE